MTDERDELSRPEPGEADILYSSGANRRRYRTFASHLVPRSRKGKLLVGGFLALLMLAEWPLLSLANRIEPAWFGIPFLFSYLLGVYILLILALVASAVLEL